jgi:hypothetical protein
LVLIWLIKAVKFLSILINTLWTHRHSAFTKYLPVIEIRVAHLFSVLCSPIMWLDVWGSVLWFPHTNDVWFVQRRSHKKKIKTKQKHQKTNTMYIGHCYPQTNTNKVNKTWALLQKTGGKDEPTVVCMRKSQHGTPNVKSHNRRAQNTTKMSNTDLNDR